MKGSAKLLGLLAIGWALLAIALGQTLPAEETSLVLGTVVFAECLSSVIATRHAPDLGAAVDAKSDALAKVLIGWIMLCVLLAPQYTLGILPFFQGQPFVILSLLALTLVLALLKHFSSAHPTARILEAVRMAVSAAIVMFLDWVGGSGSGLLLSGLVLIHLILLLAVVLLAHKAAKQEVEQQATLPEHVLAHYADLLVVPMILNGTNALYYVAARCLGVAVMMVLAHLGARALPALVLARKQRNKMQFITMAARLNLGFLLVGGGAGLAALTIGPYLASALRLDPASLQAVLIWVVLGACAPVFFGATETLFQATRRQGITFMSNLFGIGVITCTALFASQPDATFLAKWFAGAHLARSGICALILVRYSGIWPGLTALLLRQIKLF